MPFSVSAILPVLLATSAPPVDPAPIADPSAFAARLEACEPDAYSAPHPFVRGFQSAHAIEGERDGACRYTQTMPGGMRMECALSPAGRTALAASFEQMAAGRMRGSTASAPAWAAECEIVTADGKRMPAFGG